MATVDPKTEVIRQISSLQTILERYPVLMNVNEDFSESSYSFMINILKKIGVTEDAILDWLSKMLSEENGGLLSTLEIAIKTIILASFKDTYSCAVNPVLPDDVLYSVYDGSILTGGITIPLSDIDTFGQLSFNPLAEEGMGKILYFDNEPATEENPSGYTPLTIYQSGDFNAFLWYVINRGAFWAGEDEKRKCLWDNRGMYLKKFQKNPNRKVAFFDAKCQYSPFLVVRNVGPKKELFSCEYVSGTNDAEDAIRVRISKDRYWHTAANLQNKTVFEFNADYLTSMKLFDAKTLAAQVINAILGMTSSMNFEYSYEMTVMGKKVREVVKKKLSHDSANESVSADDFTFSNEEYNQMLEEAELNRKGLYPSGNEDGDFIRINQNEVIDQVYSIDSNDGTENQETIISKAFKNVSNSLSSTEQTPEKNKYTLDKDIITNFIEEFIVQVCLQILSPKIMLLYAINDKIMNPTEEEGLTSGIMSFFKNFKNLMTNMIGQIEEVILNALYDFLMGQLKPIITLFVQKLLLETAYYYKILIEELIRSCKMNSGKKNVTLDNVYGADIVPVADSPSTIENA